MSIMIVDDEMIIRESFLHWFEKYGHRVETASSGFEALDILEKTPFDLMFVDIKMPGMDGIELLEKVKEEYPETLCRYHYRLWLDRYGSESHEIGGQ